MRDILIQLIEQLAKKMTKQDLTALENKFPSHGNGETTEVEERVVWTDDGRQIRRLRIEVTI